MAARQLALLAAPGVWEARFGAALFRRVPARPGVYLLGDEQGRLIYVGKAVNLRRRLNSYRHLPLEHGSPKTARLVRETRAISWEVLASPAAALLRENELLRLHRPKFNRVNTHPEQYVRVAVMREGGVRVGLQWARGAPPAGEAGVWHGAFKGGEAARESLRAIWRLSCLAGARTVSLYDLPRGALGGRLPQGFWLPATLPAELREPALWNDYFSGINVALADRLAAVLPEAGTPDLQALAERDLERLRWFFAHGPQRNRRLCARAGLAGGWLAPEELDDLLAVEQAARSGAGN